MGFYNPDAETEFRWAHVTGISLRAGGQRLHHDTSPPSVIESAGLLEGEIFFARHYHLLDSCTTILSFFFLVWLAFLSISLPWTSRDVRHYEIG